MSWGQGANQNEIGWGRSAVNNTISWGYQHRFSWSGDTDIYGSLVVTNFLTQLIDSIVSDFETRVITDLGTFESSVCLHDFIQDNVGNLYEFYNEYVINAFEAKVIADGGVYEPTYCIYEQITTNENQALYLWINKRVSVDSGVIESNQCLKDFLTI